MVTKPLPFQLVGAKRIQKTRGRHLLADDMGLGKTFQSLYWLTKKRTQALPAVVVCPSSLKWNWQEEARNHFGIDFGVAEGRTPPRRFKTDRLIINYDILPHWLDFIDQMDPTTLILDEVQYIKNRNTNRAQAAKQVAEWCRYVLLLSGTPIENRPSEFWSSLNCAFPNEFSNFQKFGMRYCQPRRTRWGWTYNGATRIDELHHRVSRVMTRRKKSEVLKELPKKREEILVLPLTKPDEYRKRESEFVDWLKKEKKLTKRPKAVELQKMTHLRRLAAELKLPAVLETLDRLVESDEKIVVFVHHRDIGKAIYQHFKSIAVQIHGGIKGTERRSAVYKFQNNEKCRMLVGNLQAAGVGLTLTKGTVALFAEPGIKPAQIDQARDRIYRIGQKNTVRIIYTCGHNTIEQHLYKTIQRKKEIIDRCMDGKQKSSSFDLHDQLLKEIQRHEHRRRAH